MAKESAMTLDNEQIVRKAHQIAEDKDMAGWAAAFTPDGTFTDESIGVTWTGPIDGKIKRFDCYPEGTIILTQLGVFGNVGAALQH
jgi:hypothetical protein